MESKMVGKNKNLKQLPTKTYKQFQVTEMLKLDKQEKRRNVLFLDDLVKDFKVYQKDPTRLTVMDEIFKGQKRKKKM